MKTFNARTYLYIAGSGIVIILLLALFTLFIPVSHADDTQFIYVDEDDTQDSVLNKVSAFGRTTGLSILMRHTDYGNHIRTGRYAIEPYEGAFLVLRHLKNGQQKSLNVTIPEVRTMDRLAAVLSKRLMIDSTTIADALRDSAMLQKLGYDTCTISATYTGTSA